MSSIEKILGDVLPEGTSVTTPSGLTIFYCPEPRHYKVNGVEVPSVTTVLKLLSNEALPWWGMVVGVEGVLELRQRWYEAVARDAEDNELDSYWPEETGAMPSAEALVERLTKNKLTVNHTLDRASDRGTNVHLGLERWAETGHLPDPEAWPEEERGYIQGLVGFLEAVQPTPIHSELMVGSEKHGVAGRFDLFAETEEKEVRPTSRKKREVPAGKGIWDLKSRGGNPKNKGIYPKDCIQVAGYRICLEESYHIRSDYEAVVAVRPNGAWDIEISEKKPYQYLAVKAAWEALQ